jgi:predicted metalloprotease with PDZ domain
MYIRRLTFSYKVFGNDLSGTFSQLDERHANYNGGCIFMYVADHKPDPVKLLIDPPDGGELSTVAPSTGSNGMGVSKLGHNDSTHPPKSLPIGHG